MEIQESRLEFSFADGVQAQKFDDTAFYQRRYKAMEGGKGADILAAAQENLYIIEVKDCSQTAEDQDKWRRAYGGSRNMDTLAAEIAQKIAHTCACMYGVSTYGDRAKDAAALLSIAQQMQNGKIAALQCRLYVVLYLEGDFSCATRSNKVIRREICQRIMRKLKWLNCCVDVTDTSLHSARDFSVRLKPV